MSAEAMKAAYHNSWGGSPKHDAVSEYYKSGWEDSLACHSNAGAQEWSGSIVTASFEDGVDHWFLCGLEDCECPEHEGSPRPAGTYLTVRLDGNPPIGLGRVLVVVVSSDQ